jgi:hypothetical protein
MTSKNDISPLGAGPPPPPPPELRPPRPPRPPKISEAGRRAVGAAFLRILKERHPERTWELVND